MILLNPVLISVVVLCVLCLCKLNVLMSLIIASMVGALVGGIMALGLVTPVDPADPVGSKKRAQALGKTLQKRFVERFGFLRCRDLLANKRDTNEMSPAAVRMGLTGHCDIMVVSAVELVEEILAERS